MNSCATRRADRPAPRCRRAHRLLELLLLLHLDDRELLLAGDEHLLAVERHLERVGIVEDRLLLARLESRSRRSGSSPRACRRAAYGGRAACLHRLQIGVGPDFGGSTTRSRLEAIESIVDVPAAAVSRGLVVAFRRLSCRLRLLVGVERGFSASLRAASGDLTSLRSGTATSCVGFA
jgi:hypothetical protein